MLSPSFSHRSASALLITASLLVVSCTSTRHQPGQQGVDLTGPVDMPPAMRAAAAGDLAGFQNALESGAVLTATNRHGAGVLYFAAQARANGPAIFETVRAEVGEETFAELLQRRAPSNGHTAAMEAVFNVNGEVVDYLLGLRAEGVAVDFETPTVFGWTPKSFAEREQMPFAGRLPDGAIAVADRAVWLDEQAAAWRAALSPAALAEQELGLQLIAAVSAGDVDGMRAAIDAGADINGRYGRFGATALNSVTRPGMTADELTRAAAMQRALLELGADPNVAEGAVMLVPAGFREAVFGYDELVQQTVDHLRAAGESAALDQFLDYRGPMNGYTKLIDAALRGRAEVIRVLLENGADRSLRGFNGMTALDAARRYNESASSPLPVELLAALARR